MFASASSSSDSFPLKELNGSLLIFEPSEHVENINTSFGVTDAVKATVTVVDGKLAGEVYEDTLVFPKILKNSLKKHVGSGQPVLGRLGQGNAKPGQSAPWVLAEPNDADIKAATAVWTVKTPF